MKKPLLPLLLLTALAMTDAAADVIYRNNFGNNTGATISTDHSDIGWKVLRAQMGSGAAVDVSGTADAFVGISTAVGKTTTLGNVNAPTSLSNSLGMVFLSNGASPKYNALFYTEQYVVDRSAYRLDEITWDANATFDSANGGVSEQRVALRVGSQWYVSSGFTPASGNAGNFASTASSHTLNFTTETWYGLTAAAGSAFSIGAVTPLPVGDITAFGMYVTPNLSATSNMVTRFDTYAINATMIPEPSSLGLVGALAGMGMLVRFRRKGHC